MAMENKEKKGPDFGELQPLLAALQKRFLEIAKTNTHEIRFSANEVMLLIEYEFLKYTFNSCSEKIGKGFIAGANAVIQDLFSPTVASPTFARCQQPNPDPFGHTTIFVHQVPVSIPGAGKLGEPFHGLIRVQLIDAGTTPFQVTQPGK